MSFFLKNLKYQCFYVAGYDVRDKSPVMKAYMERVQQSLNPHYDEAHAAVNKMVEKFKGEVPKSMLK